MKKWLINIYLDKDEEYDDFIIVRANNVIKIDNHHYKADDTIFEIEGSIIDIYTTI